MKGIVLFTFMVSRIRTLNVAQLLLNTKLKQMQTRLDVAQQTISEHAKISSSMLPSSTLLESTSLSEERTKSADLRSETSSSNESGDGDGM